MNKLIKNIDILYNIDWEYMISISQLKADIEKLEELGATHVDIKAVDHNYTYVTFIPICQRVETDEEYKQRKKNESARKRQNKKEEVDKEIELYNKLKEKYG